LKKQGEVEEGKGLRNRKRIYQAYKIDCAYNFEEK
jgi:hypothetical protein